MGRLYNSTQPATTTRNVGPVDLRTSAGLQRTAEQAGLGSQAERVLEGKGEDPKKIFSGGFISDIFDTLNALQHGVTGTLKGKGFMEGIRTKQSFSDKDALGEHGLPGTLGGIALDIAVDPLTYIPVVGPIKAVTKAKAIIKGTKVTQKVVSAVSDSAVGQKLGTSFIYRFGQDPLYKELAERTIKNIGVSNQNLLDIVRPMTALDSETQKIIALARKAGKLEDLPGDLLAKAKPAFDEVDRLGKEAVEAGLLKKEIYEQNVGKYIARLYKKHEAPKGIIEKIPLIAKKPLRIDLSRFKKRGDIPEEIREAMGEILEAGYPTAKSMIQLNDAVEKAKFFKEVAGKWGKDLAEEGLEQLPETKRLGQLSGKFIPKPIFDDIQELIRPRDKGVAQKVVAGFKFGKVILNPSTHIRNVFSNFILNNFEGLSPARVDIYTKAAKEVAKKGELYQEARRLGLGLDTFAAQELKQLLNTPEAGKALGGVRGIADKLSNLYQKEEEWAKMAQYIYQKSIGKSPEEAWKIAERATFNYAQVTPFIRKLRESIFGFPFITFTYKVTPQVAKTLVTKPTKISNIGKIKNAIENMADLGELQRERASEPDWVRDGFYVKLPMQDKYGRSAYLDLTYILPFGDLISGQFIERGIERETGLPESVASAGLRKTPFLNIVKELARNQDFYGNRIFRPSDTTEKQLGDVMRHLVRTYAPPAVSDLIPGGYREGAERRPTIFGRVAESQKEAIEAGRGQPRTAAQEILKNLGLKVQPMEAEIQERYGETERKRALESLLKDEGVIQKFERSFIPKGKSSGRRLYP